MGRQTKTWLGNVKRFALERKWRRTGSGVWQKQKELDKIIYTVGNDPIIGNLWEKTDGSKKKREKRIALGNGEELLIFVWLTGLRLWADVVGWGRHDELQWVGARWRSFPASPASTRCRKPCTEPAAARGTRTASCDRKTAESAGTPPRFPSCICQIQHVPRYVAEATEHYVELQLVKNNAESGCWLTPSVVNQTFISGVISPVYSIAFFFSFSPLFSPPRSGSSNTAKGFGSAVSLLSGKKNYICSYQTCFLSSKYTKIAFAAEPQPQKHFWCI